jgi:hypothetical protein
LDQAADHGPSGSNRRCGHFVVEVEYIQGDPRVLGAMALLHQSIAEQRFKAETWLRFFGH